MKIKFFVTFAGLLMFVFSACDKESARKSSENLAVPTADTDKYSYVMGYDIGSGFLQTFFEDSINFNVEYLYRGIEDGMKVRDTNFTPLIAKADREAAIQALQALMQEKQQAKMAARQAKYEARAKTAKEDGEKFLAENKTKPDIKVAKSGYQYKILTKGNGPIAKLNDRVKLHLIGKFIDGEEFQNTYESPSVPEAVISELPLQVWREALTAMPVGSKWEVYAPANLAYGSQENGYIPPNSAVIFTIELVEIINIDSNSNK